MGDRSHHTSIATGSQSALPRGSSTLADLALAREQRGSIPPIPHHVRDQLRRRLECPRRNLQPRHPRPSAVVNRSVRPAPGVPMGPSPGQHRCRSRPHHGGPDGSGAACLTTLSTRNLVIVCEHIEDGAARKATDKKRCGQLLNRISIPGTPTRHLMIISEFAHSSSVVHFQTNT